MNHNLDPPRPVWWNKNDLPTKGIAKVALIPFSVPHDNNRTVKTTAEAQGREAEDARYDKTVDEIEYKNPIIQETLPLWRKRALLEG
jgi:hypothetical protein